MSVRPATHAGSWYSGRLSQLDLQLTRYLSEAPLSKSGARVVVGPHAGYAYCGSILAQSYKAWDTSRTKNVFIFSPSHYVYFKGARVSKYAYYQTPYGNIPVNTQLAKDLTTQHPKDIKYMDSSTDDQEHGLEMHMPLLHKVTKDLPQGVPNIVPILISSSDESFERRIASIIAEYISNEENSFIVSSDFCHWGARFDYTIYTADETASKLKELSFDSDDQAALEVPIYKSIEYLDKRAMQVASTGSYKDWREYIKSTGNTICGQKPIAIMLAALELYQEANGNAEPLSFNWIGYKQSSHARSVDDSSVSYASGYVVL